MANYSLSPALLDAAYVSFDTIFQSVFTDTKTFYQDVASEISSSTATTRHFFMDRLPAMREWLGERIINNMIVRAQELPNKIYENTIRVKRTDLEDDLLGIYAPLFSELARSAKLWPDQLVADLIKNAANVKSYDQQNFFDANHPVNPEGSAEVQSNLFPATPLTADNLAMVRAVIMAYKTRDNVPMELVPNLLVVPPQLEYAARKILFGELIGSAVPLGAAGNGAAAPTNILRGVMDLLVLPRLADRPNEWYCLITNRAIKPFIFQKRLAPEFTFLNRPEDSNVFLRDEYIFGVRARGNVGVGPWFLAAKASA